MTDEELREYLRESGYPEHVRRAGRQGLIERWRKFVADVARASKHRPSDTTATSGTLARAFSATRTS